MDQQDRRAKITACAFSWAVTVFFAFVCYIIGGVYDSKIWIDRAIAHHAMHYDQTTGNPVWNDEVKP